MKILLIIIGILISGILGALLLNEYIDSNRWELISSIKSPNEKYGLYLYQYNSDGNRHAPYGSYIFLHPEHKVQSPKSSPVILAGYCQRSVEIAWKSNDSVEIQCITNEDKDIRTLSKKVFGIGVNAKTQATHNKSIKPTPGGAAH